MKPLTRYIPAPIEGVKKMQSIPFLHEKPFAGCFRVTIEAPGQPSMRRALLAFLNALEGDDESTLDDAADLAREALGMEPMD